MQKVLPLALALLTVALAGCSDETPSGEFSFQNHALTVAGTASNEYTAFSDPVGGQVPDDSPTGTDCAQDNLPPEVGGGQQCTQPRTNITLTFTQLPDPQGNSYIAYLVDASGTSPDVELGMLEAGAGGSFHLNYTEAEDYSNEEEYSYTDVEVRLSVGSAAVVVGTASADPGSQDFALNEDLVSGVGFDATWSGKKLTLTVSGLNTTVGYTGWLVDETGEHTEQFSVANGEVEHDAERNIDAYSEFHIHVAGTKANVGVATID